MNDTIFAPATAPGRGAIAVVRLSGPGAGAALLALAGVVPDPRRATLRQLRARAGEVIDEALVLWFPAPASYTGEDSAELHVHGGAAVSAAIVQALMAEGLRLADPGEFTRRAFERGRMDLTQAEAVADLVAAETSAQRRQALAQLGGGLALRYEAWRDALLDLLAMLEAAIDFPDEEIPPAVEAAALERLQDLAEDMDAAAVDPRGEQVRQGVRLALIGAPNVGKSSLLNVLAGRDAAIVTPVAGTTRDVVEISLVMAGQLVVLADTAGLRTTGDVIEAEGVRRARAWAQSADIRIGVVDSTRMETARDAQELLRTGDFLVMNKTDLVGPPWGAIQTDQVAEVVYTHATWDGVDALRRAIELRLVQITSPPEFPAVTQARHRSLLREAVGHLQRGSQQFHLGAELAAEDVRLAVRSLERVTGRINPEAVLDRVFASFCIGK